MLKHFPWPKSSFERKYFLGLWKVFWVLSIVPVGEVGLVHYQTVSGWENLEPFLTYDRRESVSHGRPSTGNVTPNLSILQFSEELGNCFSFFCFWFCFFLRGGGEGHRKVKSAPDSDKESGIKINCNVLSTSKKNEFSSPVFFSLCIVTK